jgi:regulator of sirC expression with transglutaminase-like and TPR domain
LLHDRLPEDPFVRAVDQPDSRIDLARAALLVARDEYPGLDVDGYLQRLQAMAEIVRPRISLTHDPDQAIDTLNEFVFRELGFTGNRDDYYNPRNSFLNQVIDRRTGIPITLSVVYMEIGHRVGLPLRGVSLPGHFIVRYAEAQPQFIDPFNAGERLTETDCWHRLLEIFGTPIKFRREWLEPVGNRQILTRMLYNLKSIYIRQEQIRRAIPVVEKILALNPDAAQELRDLGSMHGMLGNYGDALIYLQQYLVYQPDASDAQTVQIHMKRLLTRIARWN